MTRQHHPAIAPATPPVARLRHAEPRSTAPPVDFDDVAVALARWYLEFRSGRRSFDQVQGLVSPGVRQRLRSQADSRLCAPPVDPVVNAIVQRPNPGRVEAVVLLRQADRVVAVAVSFVRRGPDTGWQVVELTTPGEDERTDPRRTAAAGA